MDTVFKALADPTRRKILDLLQQRDLTAGEIAEHFTISKPSISKHLSILKNAGLVLVEKKGQFLLYSLHTTLFQDVIKWMIQLKGDGSDA